MINSRRSSGLSAIIAVVTLAVVGADRIVSATVIGDVDRTFGDEIGAVLFSTGSYNDTFYAVATQPDGKIVAVGTADFNPKQMAIVRLNADGSADSTFGSYGVLEQFGTYDAYALGVAIQPDGKVVVAGYSVGNSSGSNVTILRYLPDGTRDPAFGSGGLVIMNAEGGSNNDGAVDVVLQPDGKIVLAGTGAVGASTDILVIRLLTDGSPDPTFGSAGIVRGPSGGTSIDAEGIALQPDGKIIVSANYTGPLVIRYNADGSLDTTFGPNADGISQASRLPIRRVLVQPDGKIVGRPKATWPPCSSGGTPMAPSIRRSESAAMARRPRTCSNFSPT
jgi:uncharacterized delta-60 repeat protein